MKNLSIILFLLILLSCSKQAVEKSNQLSFDLGGRHYQYSNVTFSSQPFCGSTLYNIEGVIDSSNIFLISIVCDSLHSGIYSGDTNIGANFFSRSFSAVTTSMTFNLDKESGNISANFYATLVSLGKSYSLTNGSITINNN